MAKRTLGYQQESLKSLFPTFCILPVLSSASKKSSNNATNGQARHNCIPVWLVIVIPQTQTLVTRMAGTA